jgi:hypothetical protein
VSLPRDLRLRLFPSTDVAFVREVKAAAEVAAMANTDDAGQRAILENDLRRWYRSIQIHAQDEFGRLERDLTRTWYVYRDGRVRSTSPALERLYGALAAARVTCRASRVAIHDAHVVARLAGFTSVRDADADFAAAVAGSDGPNDQ